MNCCTRNSCSLYVLALLVGLLMANLFPTEALVRKSAAQDKDYTHGWSEGCMSGINATTPLKSILIETPFVRTTDATDLYRSGWNEGYTSCRIAQDSVDHWVQLYLILATLLFVGARFKSSQA